VSLILSIYVIQISALIISALFLSIIKLIHPPKEGIFRRNLKDKDYVYWNLRNTIKKWPLWITATNPFPWLKNRFSLRFYGVKIGKKVMCDNCWISSEFVDFMSLLSATAPKPLRSKTPTTNIGKIFLIFHFPPLINNCYPIWRVYIRFIVIKYYNLF